MRNATTLSPKQALRRYFKLFVPSMAAYVLFIALAVWLIKGGIVSGPIMFLVAALPAFAALGFLYGWFRFIRETDELQRRVQTEAIMVGVAAILTLTLTWGILEMFILELPRLPVFWVFPIFMIAQGLASWRLSKKYGTGFCLP